MMRKTKEKKKEENIFFPFLFLLALFFSPTLSFFFSRSFFFQTEKKHRRRDGCPNRRCDARRPPEGVHRLSDGPENDALLGSRGKLGLCARGTRGGNDSGERNRFFFAPSIDALIINAHPSHLFSFSFIPKTPHLRLHQGLADSQKPPELISPNMTGGTFASKHRSREKEKEFFLFCDKTEKKNGFFLSFFFDPLSTSTSTFFQKYNKKYSDVRLLAPLHALRLGDQAPELPPPGLPREQRVRPAQSDAAVVDRSEGRRPFFFVAFVVVAFESCAVAACGRRRFRVKRKGGEKRQKGETHNKLDFIRMNFVSPCRSLSFFRLSLFLLIRPSFFPRIKFCKIFIFSSVFFFSKIQKKSVLLLSSSSQRYIPLLLASSATAGGTSQLPPINSPPLPFSFPFPSPFPSPTSPPPPPLPLVP